MILEMGSTTPLKNNFDLVIFRGCFWEVWGVCLGDVWGGFGREFEQF